MRKLTRSGIGRLLLAIFGSLLFFAFLAKCYAAYLQPEFLLDLLSTHLIC
ncbi:hypothetical protein [Paraherbaspirillum soli]|uniref:Uncharacterized protein n=1 Tax=Paraherbaspirillum soli TaxID=631222 RepID=A0ABW0M307_9BURK